MKEISVEVREGYWRSKSKFIFSQKLKEYESFLLNALNIENWYAVQYGFLGYTPSQQGSQADNRSTTYHREESRRYESSSTQVIHLNACFLSRFEKKKKKILCSRFSADFLS